MTERLLLISLLTIASLPSRGSQWRAYLSVNRSFTETKVRIQSDSAWAPMTAVYLEIGGKFLPSLNLDFRRRENLAFAVGATYWYDAEGDGPQSLFLPSLSAYYLAGKRHQVELGGGLGPFIGTRVGLSSILLFGNVGYRYQKRNGTDPPRRLHPLNNGADLCEGCTLHGPALGRRQPGLQFLKANLPSYSLRSSKCWKMALPYRRIIARDGARSGSSDRRVPFS